MYKKIILSFASLIITTIVLGQVPADTVNFNNLATTDADAIFNKVEEEAYFPNGTSGWRQYLNANLNVDVPIKRKAPEGSYTVIVRFIVTKKGEIKDVVPETTNGYGMEDELIRVIKNGPNWIPARQNGRAVNAYKRQPVTFVLSKN